MSILNAWITPGRALIGVDTEGAIPGAGPITFRSKLIPLVHCNAVLACRGQLVFLNQLFGIAHLFAEDFDALVDGMPEVLPAAFNAAITAANHLGMSDTSAFDLQIVVLVGWSKRAGRLIGYEYTQTERAKGFVQAADIPYHIAPWAKPIEGFADPDSPESLARLAEAQCKFVRENYPDGAAGGRLVCVQMSAQEMQIDSSYELGRDG